LALAQRDKELFFDPPNSSADVQYWSKISYWNLDEAVALSFALDPRVVNWARVEHYTKSSPFAKSYQERRILVTRAKTMGQLWEATVPAIFLAWARRTNFRMPEELENAVTALGNQIADWKTLFDRQVLVSNEMQEKRSTERAAFIEDSKKLLDRLNEHSERNNALAQNYIDSLEKLKRQNAELQNQLDELEKTKQEKVAKDLPPRERETVLKLIIGMAVAFYGYDPQSARNSAIGQIRSDLALKGIKMDDGTIRKYLDEAKVLWPFK
jgi:DNA repair exonuclease SbcCD ATPase subunit